MPCADGDSRSACSAVSTETMLLLVAESQRKSCPVPLLCGWRNLPKGASGPFPPELLQKLLCWISTELTEGDLGNLISCTASARVLQTLAVFLVGFLSEAKNRKLSKEVSAGTHWDLWGTQSVGTIIRFVYLLLAKLSISCQHLKSCHSGHIQHWQRKLGIGVEERHWKMNPEVCTVTTQCEAEPHWSWYRNNSSAVGVSWRSWSGCPGHTPTHNATWQQMTGRLLEANSGHGERNKIWWSLAEYGYPRSYLTLVLRRFSYLPAGGWQTPQI